KPKFPRGGQIASENIHIDDAGNWVGDFKDLTVVLVKPDGIPNATALKPGTPLVLFAYADNDGSSSAEPVNLLQNPPTPADFITSQLFELPCPEDGTETPGIQLAIDSPVNDQDFDGILDEDKNGDGVPDDNCPTIPNALQTDSD